VLQGCARKKRCFSVDKNLYAYMLALHMAYSLRMASKSLTICQVWNFSIGILKVRANKILPARQEDLKIHFMFRCRRVGLFQMKQKKLLRNSHRKVALKKTGAPKGAPVQPNDKPGEAKASRKLMNAMPPPWKNVRGRTFFYFLGFIRFEIRPFAL
jgi:hypothetical protein